MSKIQIKKLIDSAIVPTAGSSHSAGYDLYSIENHILMPMDRKLFKTGISIGIPSGQYGRIAPRSGLAYKDGIDVLAGVIDEDYRGEIGVILINFGKTEKEIKFGDKIAQIIFEFYNKVEWEVVNELTQTQRNTDGYGSTDKKGKPLTEVFAEEQKKFEAKQGQPPSSILDKYKESGGVKTDIPYIERIRKREQS